MGTPKNEPHHCDALLERFSEYLDREMDEQSARELEAHLEECKACATMMHEFKFLLDSYHAFRGIQTEPCPSEECRKRLRSTILGE